MNHLTQIESADVLVIGCGPAGLMTALGARKAGCRVLAVDKGLVGNDCSAVGAKQFAGTGDWSPEKDDAGCHFVDTIQSGCEINVRKLVHLLTSKIGGVVRDLDRIGMPFDRNESGEKIEVHGPVPGHSRPRSIRYGDITGKLLVDTLHTECRRRGVPLLSEHVAVDLVLGPEGIAGALLLDLASGGLVFVRCKAVVIASGGIGCLYELTSNPAQMTGDGIALALRSGAELMDLEFVQFYPVTVLYPPALRGMNLNSHHLGGRLLNAKGERFMSKYYPGQMELVTRDKLSQSIFKEIQSGLAGPHGGVFLDTTMISSETYAREIPTEWNLAVSAEVNLTREYLEVAPSAHYYMGGIRIDQNCRTTVKGLFAAGECCAGVQGANRLADNGLTEALVFGSIAGKSAGEYAGSIKLPSIDGSVAQRQAETISQRFSKDGIRPSEATAAVRRIMTECVGIIRDEAGLNNAVEQLRVLAQRKSAAEMGGRWLPSLLEAFNAGNMTRLALALALAARERRESRGAHSRADYPQRNDRDFKQNIINSQDDFGGLSFRLEDMSETRNNHWPDIK